MRRRDRDRKPTRAGELCLGLVILPVPGQLESLQTELEQHASLRLGTPHGHRLPAVATVATGEDEAFIQSLEAHPSVLRVEVAYAELFPTEITP